MPEDTRPVAGEVQSQPSEYVKSLERGLAVIKAFGEDRQRMTITEVAKEVGMTRGATRRFLLTLEHLGYVKASGRYYTLSPNVLELGFTFLSAQPWWRYAQRVAQRLATEFGEPCAVGVLEDTSVVYVCYATAQRFSVFNRAVGTRLPAYPTAIGRILLGQLERDELLNCLNRSDMRQLTPFTRDTSAAICEEVERVLQQGYSYVDQELEIGLSSFAVPILNRSGEIVAALSMSFRATTSRTDQLKERYLDRLKAAAIEISAGVTD